MKLTYRDLVDLASMSATEYGSQPPRLEVPGQPAEGLPESARRALAWLEASLKILGRYGILTVDGPLIPQGEKNSVWEG